MKRLTSYEREQIAYWHDQGLRIREIASKVGRDHSVISRELRRNSAQLFPYQASSAQYYAERRSHKTNRRKLDKDERLKEWVRAKLLQKWSPEQIAGRLKNQPPPALKGASVGVETIYQWIYATSPQGEPWLYHNLRRKHLVRQRKYGRKPRQQVKIKELVSIYEREESTALGQLEADSIVGKHGKSGLSVHFDRIGQFVRIHHLLSLKAEETLEALRATLDDYPLGFIQSITFDRGSESALHYQLREPYQIQTYHCDPYCPHQKGGVENVNGLIRQYFPKGTDFRSITPDQVMQVEEALNNRPRKKLNYLTPSEYINLVH
jgi:IS30 family transposase